MHEHNIDPQELQRLADIGRVYEAEQKRFREKMEREVREDAENARFRAAVKDVLREREIEDEVRFRKAVADALEANRQKSVAKFKATAGKALGAALMAGAAAAYVVFAKDAFE